MPGPKENKSRAGRSSRLISGRQNHTSSGSYFRQYRTSSPTHLNSIAGVWRQLCGSKETLGSSILQASWDRGEDWYIAKSAQAETGHKLQQGFTKKWRKTQYHDFSKQKITTTFYTNPKLPQHFTTMSYLQAGMRICITKRKSQIWLILGTTFTDTRQFQTIIHCFLDPPPQNNNQDSEAILDERAQKKDIIKISVKLWTKQLWKQRAKAKLLPGAMPHGYGGTTMQERPLVAHSS